MVTYDNIYFLDYDEENNFSVFMAEYNSHTVKDIEEIKLNVIEDIKQKYELSPQPNAGVLVVFSKELQIYKKIGPKKSELLNSTTNNYIDRFVLTSIYGYLVDDRILHAVKNLKKHYKINLRTSKGLLDIVYINKENKPSLELFIDEIRRIRIKDKL